MKTKVVALVMLIGAGVTGGKLTRDRESVRLQPGPVVTETAQGWAVDCTGKPDCGVQCDGAGCDVQDGKTDFGVEWPEADDWSTNKGANCSIACDKGSCSVTCEAPLGCKASCLEPSQMPSCVCCEECAQE